MGVVGSGSWEMQGHILLQHSWVLGLRMRSDCVPFWMYTLLSRVSFILRQAVYVGPRQPPAAHDQVFSVQVTPTKFSEFSSICPALYFMLSPGPNSVTLMVETRVSHPPPSERAGAQEFERGTCMEYGQEAAAAQSRSSREERPHVQGQRNPSKTVGTERGHQRADRLKPQSQKTSQSDHRTTVVSNSVKLTLPWGATQDGRVMVERSDRMWSTGEGTGKPLQCSCLENPMNSMRRQNDRTLKGELPRWVGAQYAAGDQWRNNSRKNEGMETKQKQHPGVDVTGDRSKVRCCKEQYCIGAWNVRSMNQDKLEVVKQEMARVNVNILGNQQTKMNWNG